MNIIDNNNSDSTSNYNGSFNDSNLNSSSTPSTQFASTTMKHKRTVPQKRLNQSVWDNLSNSKRVKRNFISSNEGYQFSSSSNRFKGTSLISDQYDIGSKIGEGTFGVVFQATCKSNNNKVAIKKILVHSSRDGFPTTSIREITFLKLLQHPNIVPLTDMTYGEDPRKDSNPIDNPPMFYMVFPYMDHDLTGLLERPDFKPPPSQIKLYMRQLCEGTAFMHANGVLHRDMKASNILISNDGSLRIADFGLARICHKLKSNNNKQRIRNYTNMVVTRFYRPPELIIGEKSRWGDYGPEVDMWGIGCIFGEMFTHRPILQGQTDIDQLKRIFELCGDPTEDRWPGWKDILGQHNLDISIRGYKNGKLKDTFMSLPNFDTNAIGLLQALLCMDPKKRISARDALDHDYFWSKPYAMNKKDVGFIPPSHEYDNRKTKFPPQRANAPPVGFPSRFSNNIVQPQSSKSFSFRPQPAFQQASNSFSAKPNAPSNFVPQRPRYNRPPFNPHFKQQQGIQNNQPLNPPHGPVSSARPPPQSMVKNSHVDNLNKDDDVSMSMNYGEPETEPKSKVESITQSQGWKKVGGPLPPQEHLDNQYKLPSKPQQSNTNGSKSIDNNDNERRNDDLNLNNINDDIEAGEINETELGDQSLQKSHSINSNNNFNFNKSPPPPLPSISPPKIPPQPTQPMPPQSDDKNKSIIGNKDSANTSRTESPSSYNNDNSLYSNRNKNERSFSKIADINEHRYYPDQYQHRRSHDGSDDHFSKGKQFNNRALPSFGSRDNGYDRRRRKSDDKQSHIINNDSSHQRREDDRRFVNRFSRKPEKPVFNTNYQPLQPRHSQPRHPIPDRSVSGNSQNHYSHQPQNFSQSQQNEQNEQKHQNMGVNIRGRSQTHNNFNSNNRKNGKGAPRIMFPTDN